MSRLIRWLVAFGAAVGVFWVCLWLFQFASFSWLPRADADRWVVAAAFAGVAAGAIGACMNWWAGREDQPSAVEARTVRQKARASGKSRITQIGGDQRNGER